VRNKGFQEFRIYQKLLLFFQFSICFNLFFPKNIKILVFTGKKFGTHGKFWEFGGIPAGIVFPRSGHLASILNYMELHCYCIGVKGVTNFPCSKIRTNGIRDMRL
jgi:hypothetical protein